MTEKELLYVEDAINHELYMIKTIRETEYLRCLCKTQYLACLV